MCIPQVPDIIQKLNDMLGAGDINPDMSDSGTEDGGSDGESYGDGESDSGSEKDQGKKKGHPVIGKHETAEERRVSLDGSLFSHNSIGQVQFLRSNDKYLVLRKLQ